MAFYTPPKTTTSTYTYDPAPYTSSPVVQPTFSPYYEPSPYYPPVTYPQSTSTPFLSETTNLPTPLPTPSYDPTGTYVPSGSTEGPIPTSTYITPSAPAPSAPSDFGLAGLEAPADASASMSASEPVSNFGLDAGMPSGLPADLGGPPSGAPGLGPSSPSGQAPGLAALQGLLGRSSGVQSPGLQGLLEGTAGRLGGQARQRYGRQFQTFLANQRAAQGQRGDAMAGMGDTGASSLQGSMQMQMALDRLRAALDMPSRTPQRSRAPQFASSSSSGGGLSSSSTSPYLY